MRGPEFSDLWYVTARVSRPVANGWTAQRDLPTFVVDGGIQGVTSPGAAARVAAEVLMSDALPEGWKVVADIRQGGQALVTGWDLSIMGQLDRPVTNL